MRANRMRQPISAAGNFGYRPAVADLRRQIMKTPNQWLNEIKMALSDDLLTPGRRIDIRQERLRAEVRRVRGHCYIATEAAYHLFGKELGYVPERVRCADGDTHWWLRNKMTKHVIDPTIEETGGKFDYQSGRAGGFLTIEPSRRCRILMQRVLDGAPRAERNTTRDSASRGSARETCILIS
jgi:hypothetical protein